MLSWGLSIYTRACKTPGPPRTPQVYSRNYKQPQFEWKKSNFFKSRLSNRGFEKNIFFFSFRSWQFQIGALKNIYIAAIKNCCDLKKYIFKSRQFYIAAIKKNCRDKKTNRSISAAAQISAPNRDFPAIIRSLIFKH